MARTFQVSASCLTPLRTLEKHHVMMCTSVSTSRGCRKLGHGVAVDTTDITSCRHVAPLSSMLVSYKRVEGRSHNVEERISTRSRECDLRCRRCAQIICMRLKSTQKHIRTPLQVVGMLANASSMTSTEMMTSTVSGHMAIALQWLSAQHLQMP